MVIADLIRGVLALISDTILVFVRRKKAMTCSMWKDKRNSPIEKTNYITVRREK